MAALERAGERLEADVVGAAVAGERHEGQRLGLRERASLRERPVGRLDTARRREPSPLFRLVDGELVQTLWQHGLVDEFSVLTFPMVLGRGKRLFGAGATPSGLKLIKAKAFPTGVIVANYKADGAVKTGSFQLAESSEAELERRRKLS